MMGDQVTLRRRASIAHVSSGNLFDAWRRMVRADLLGELPQWQTRGLCGQADPEAFFPEQGGPTDTTRQAIRLCNRCEVQAECLRYALDHDERFGIWGGKTEHERRRLRRQAGG